MSDMNLRQLRMLSEVAKLGTISAAADSLGYTASAVSQQLSGLEKSTRVALLDRVGRNVRLTDAGRELVRHADGLLSGFEAAQVAIERVNNEVAGELRISVYETVASTLIPPLVSGLRATHPDLVIRTREVEPRDALSLLAHGEVDMAFTIEYDHLSELRPTGIEARSLIRDRMFLAIPASRTDLAERVTLDVVSDQPIITPPLSSSCGECVLMACRAAGFEPDVHHEVDDYRALMRLTAAGLGVGLVPELAMLDIPAGVRLLRLDPPVVRTVQLAWRAGSAQRPAVAAVNHALDQVIAELGLGVGPAADRRAG